MQDAIKSSLGNTKLEHSLTIGSREPLRCCLKPLTHTGAIIPESTWAQIGQEVANIQRRVRQTKPIKVYHKHALAVEEQLAGFKTSVCRSIGIRLQRL